MIRRYNTDDIDQVRMLTGMTRDILRQSPGMETPQAIPRRTRYGDAPGLVPLGDYPDKLVDPKDYKEVIAHCHESQIFPMYHQRASWAPPGVKWNQNGLPYCWAWGAVASLMDCIAREGKPVPLLSPVSLGFTVNWRSVGNYLESAIAGLRSRGVCEQKYTPDIHSRTYSKYLDGWEDNALLHRLPKEGGVFDTNPQTMVQHMISVLRTGSSGYIAYNWWGHALEVVGLRWDESQVNNIVVIDRNSHNEDDLIELTGSRAIPDELYAFTSSAT